MRLSAYFALFCSLRYIRSIQDEYFTERNFLDVSLRVIDASEIKKMKRAYQIKRAEAEDDKKALAKYKYDP